MTVVIVPRSKLRSKDRVRRLTAVSVGLLQPEHELADDDSVLKRVEQLLADGYAGVIFSGPPGTSKSWYAAEVAKKLADAARFRERVRFIQFHASYQYEDFVQGYVPTQKGFTLTDKHLLQMCAVALKAKGKACFIVIDELSRCDPSRVFGEALTYVEMSKREQTFHLASGEDLAIPDNLFFIATMNPLDRGVDEVDMAFERRFATMALDPDEEILRKFLEDNKMPAPLAERLVTFFRYLQAHRNPYCRIGHAYFKNVKDASTLGRIWDNQLAFHFRKTFRLDEEGFAEVEKEWEKVLQEPIPPATAPDQPPA